MINYNNYEEEENDKITPIKKEDSLEEIPCIQLTPCSRASDIE